MAYPPDQLKIVSTKLPPVTLVVNLFAGPGVGKSTTAALVFAKLKIDGVNAEMASEYAKDLTWEKRRNALFFQPYVASKQIWRVHRLLGQVDVVITDSPILLSSVYQGEGYTPSFEAYLVDTFRQWNTLNFHLIRNDSAHRYNPAGRSQTLEEAEGVDATVATMLSHFRVDVARIAVQSMEKTADVIVELIKTQLPEPTEPNDRQGFWLNS